MRKNAFSLVDILVVPAVLFIICFMEIAPVVVLNGNFWFSESGVLRELQIEHPGIVRISKVNRNIVSPSEIHVKDTNDVSSIYRLDTSILFNYDLRPSE